MGGRKGAARGQTDKGKGRERDRRTREVIAVLHLLRCPC